MDEEPGGQQRDKQADPELPNWIARCTPIGCPGPRRTEANTKGPRSIFSWATFISASPLPSGIHGRKNVPERGAAALTAAR
jgi:hypothetical protein